MTFNIKEFEEKLFTSLEDIRKLNVYKEELERKKIETEKLISDLDEKLGLLTIEKRQLEKLNDEIQRELEEKKHENTELKGKLDEETQRNKNMVPIKEYQNILEMNGRLLYLAQNTLRDYEDKIEIQSSAKDLEKKRENDQVLDNVPVKKEITIKSREFIKGEILPMNSLLIDEKGEKEIKLPNGYEITYLGKAEDGNYYGKLSNRLLKEIKFYSREDIENLQGHEVYFEYDELLETISILKFKCRDGSYNIIRYQIEEDNIFKNLYYLPKDKNNNTAYRVNVKRG